MFFNRNKFAAALNRNKAAEVNNKGFSLVEASIVLGIVALVIGGIWVGAAAVTENFKVSKAEEQVLTIAQELRRFYFGSRSTAGLTTAVAINQNLFPVDMVYGSTAQNPWDGSVAIASVSGNTQNFSITFNNIPSDACATISTRLSLTGPEIGLRNIRVGTSSMWAYDPSSDGTVTAPITPVQAATACGTGNANAQWEFSIR